MLKSKILWSTFLDALRTKMQNVTILKYLQVANLSTVHLKTSVDQPGI